MAGTSSSIITTIPGIKAKDITTMTVDTIIISIQIRINVPKILTTKVAATKTGTISINLIRGRQEISSLPRIIITNSSSNKTIAR